MSFSTTTMTNEGIELDDQGSAPDAPAAGQTLVYSRGGDLYWIANGGSETQVATGGDALSNIVEDTSPQLGADLDTNSFNIAIDDNHGVKDENGNELLWFQTTGSAVNYLEMSNAQTDGDPMLAAVGDDANVYLRLKPKGSAAVDIGTGDAAGTLSSYGDQDLLLQTGNDTTGNIRIVDGANGDIQLAPNGTGTVAATRLALSVNLSLASGATVTAILDEDAMGTDSATALATQQSIKAYVDASVAGENELSEMNDVNLTTPGDAAMLLYDTGTSTWRDAAMSGDATISDTGALTIASDAVEPSMINILDDSLAATTTHFLIADGTDYSSFALSGDVTCTNAGVVTIGNDKIDSQHYAAASIDNEHLADDAVDSDEIAAGAIDLAHMSANSVDSDQYVDGSIDLVHMSANSVDSDQYVDGSVDNVHLANSSLTVGSTSISLGATSTTLAGLTSLDCTAANQAIYATAGANTITIGAATSTVKCANDLTVTGDLVVNGTQTAVNSTQLNIEDKKVRLGVPGGMTVDGDATYTLTSNVVTVTNSSHGFSNSEYVYISDPADSITEGVYQISSVADVNTFTFAFTASNVGSATAINHSIDNVTAATGDGGGIFVSVASTTPTGIEWDSTNGWQILGGDLDLAASKNLSFAGTSILADSAGTLTLSNVDALDATTEATIEAAIDTLGNLTSAASLATVGTIGTGVWQGTAIATGYIAGDAIDGTKLADNAVDSEHYTDGSIDLVHMSANSVDSDQYVDGSIDTAHLADDAVTGAKIALFDDALAATTTHFLIADGTDYSSFALSGDVTCTNGGAVSLAATNTNLTTLANVTTVGALDAGSITSNFTSIDIGAGALAGGSLDLSDGNITNCGDVNCDSISADDSAVGLDIKFEGVTTTNKMTLTDNLVNALNINEGGNIYMKFSTADGQEGVAVGADAAGMDFACHGATTGKYFLWDESLDAARIEGQLGIGKAPANDYAIDVVNTAGAAGRVRANAFVTYSDRELKRDIAPIDNALDMIKKLEPVTYKMNSSDEVNVGFIAQEVAKVVPEVCAIDEKGVGRGIDYGRLTSLLAGAVQSQQAQIEELRDIIVQLGDGKQVSAKMGTLKGGLTPPSFASMVDEHNKK